MASGISFQGVSSGLQTDALVNAIIQQDSQPMLRLQAKQAMNVKRMAALKSLKSSANDLSISVSSIYDALKSKKVTSTDSNQTYVSATATGSASGSYRVSVTSLAAPGQVSVSVADPNAAIVSGNASFAVQGTDGTVKAFALGNNSLNGLRDAINASGAGVTATIVNTGTGATPYQLVVSATSTGTGTTGGVVRLAAINNADGSATTLDPSVSTLAGGALTGTFASPTGLSGGAASSGASLGKDASFSVNGIAMVRSSNTVKDAVDGITFTLKKGDASNETTLTVGQDVDAATTAVQAMISKFNAMLKTYRDASTPVNDGSGEIKTQPLEGDAVSRTMINSFRTAIAGVADGLPVTAKYKSGADVGIKTNGDGTLSLDTTVFKNALNDDAAAVQRVFGFSGTSTAAGVQYGSSTSATATGPVDFNLTYAAGGAVSGSLTYNGTTYSGLTGANGILQGPAGSPLEGLSLNVSGSGTGTITLARGMGQRLQDAVASQTSFSGNLQNALTEIDSQNKSLASRIDTQQSLLDRKKAALKARFNQMEYTISQMRASSGGLSGM